MTDRVYTSHYAITYATQGHGAERYARGAAERSLARVVAFGLTGRIVRVSHPKYHRWPHYDVVVQCDASVFVVLLAAPPLGLRTTIQHLLQAGVNPRVYYPLLPPTYAKDLGLDAFGQDTQTNTPGPRP